LSCNQEVGNANITNPQDTQKEEHRIRAFSCGDTKRVQWVKPPFGNYDSETVTIAVSAYGKVGGVVEGTFSGMLINQLNSTRKPITEGIFTAQRHLNVE
jgi:hypothetical protein